jgi:hypothetical protein
MDDFEQRLQRQPQRELPPPWREPILRAARAAASPDRPVFDAWLGAWWREWSAPVRLAWAGIAVAWLVIAGLHLAARTGDHTPVQTAARPVAPDVRALLSEQRRLFAELLPTAEKTSASAQSKPAERPRSERRDEPGFRTSEHFAPQPPPALV